MASKAKPAKYYLDAEQLARMGACATRLTIVEVFGKNGRVNVDRATVKKIVRMGFGYRLDYIPYKAKFYKLVEMINGVIHNHEGNTKTRLTDEEADEVVSLLNDAGDMLQTKSPFPIRQVFFI